MSCTIKILISNSPWSRARENSAGFYMQGKQSLLTFRTISKRWSRSSSYFYALTGQNLTGEFMRKMYAASGNLFSDSWSWQSFVSSTCHVFNCLFALDVQNEYNYYQDSSCNSWLVCLLDSLIKIIGNPISCGIVFVFHLAWCVRGFKRLK